MSHLPFTLLAYLLNGISVTISKFLLKNIIPEPLTYIFYISLVSILAILLLPFTHVPSFEVFIIASASTLLWTTGAYFLFKALKSGQISRVIPVVGTIIPLILLLFASGSSDISSNQILAVLILVLGLIVITLSDWKGAISKGELILEILSGTFFALSYILLRQAYLMDNFLTVIVYSRLILLPVGIAIILHPKLRATIITKKGLTLSLLSPSGLIFILGQISGGISELLILFSISLANPALVNSLQGTQYVFLLLFDFFFFKKAGVFTLTKIAGLILIAVGLFILAFS